MMRRWLLVLLVLFVGACGVPQQKQLAQNDMNQQSKAETLAPQIAIKETTVINEKIQKDEPYAELSVKELELIDIIQQEGIPNDNFWPRSKAQITIYKKENQFTVYYFKENKVMKKKIFTSKEFDQLKASSMYPNNLYKELGTIK